MATNKINILIAILLTLSVSVHSKDIKYKVIDIPKELKENARSVVRNEEIVLEVKSQSKALVKGTYVITILNKNGLSDACFYKFYDKFTKILNIKGRVFNENGEQIKRIGLEEIIDHSAISGYSIFEDNRVKYFDPEIRNYPFTVEYSYEQSFDGLISFPSWDPQPRFNLAVEKSSYKAVIPKNLKFRYLEQNTTSKALISSDTESNIYYWEAISIKALEWEAYSVPNQKIFPSMIAAPADFEIEGYKGNLTSWENFGRFISNLNTGKNILNDEIKKELNQLVAGISDDYEKIRKIYEFMQDRTRYVSIQVGIGGWQPFDASTVHRLAYGDCKALTNYMMTMLEAIGLKANYCLVNAGDDAPQMIKEFPSSQFNHAFLCVPLKTDTIWLECTSQRLPCGFIGDFTDDRDILLIEDENSRVVHTKIYSLDENKVIRTSNVKIEENGKGSVEMYAIYKGLKYNSILKTFLADNSDKKRMISERLKFPGFQLTNFKYKENRAIIPSIEETINVNFDNYITSLGSKCLLLLNFSNRIVDAPQQMRTRKTNFYIRRSSIDTDTIIYKLPSTLKPESLPDPYSIKTQFGEYYAKVELSNNQLIYVRSFLINKGQYPASDYTGFVDFFDKVISADDLKCVLIKN